MLVGPGTRLGPYELGELLGAGGMGAVFRARDTRLSRSVAIKVLPAGLHANAQQRERLAREARAISALSHPNICALYDVGSSDGIDYLVMELLEGETLAERLRRGPLPVDQAVALSIDLALALDAAHRAGLIHRDLKPGNIMLTRNGARLLDFGLAKIVSVDASNEDAQTTPTPLTREGAMVGTLRYMAPEQLEGRLLDSRTDIFAFGLVLFEMLTGKPAGSQPARLGSADSVVPADVGRIVDRCLERDPDDRWQSARDLAEALRWTRQPMATSVPRKTLPLIPIAAIAALIAALAVGGWMLTRRRGDDDVPLRSVRFSIAPPPGRTFAQNPIMQELAVSPDGKTLALVALEGQRRKLYVRSLDALESRPLEGTDGAAGLFWSPDSRWIAFFSAGEMKKIPVDGGPAQTICPAQGGNGSWGSDGKILFSEWGPGTSEAVRMVDERGGEVKDVTDPKRGWGVWASFLPDNRHFIFFGMFKNAEGIYVGSIDNPNGVRLLLRTKSRAEVRGDNIFYVRDAVLVRQRFNTRTLAVEGDPVPIAGSAFSFAPLGTAQFSVSSNASVIALQQIPVATQLVWRDWSGRELGRVGKPELYRHFAVSPDGQRVAADIFDKVTGSSNISFFDLDRGVRTVITSNAVGVSAPVWLRSGTALIVSWGNVEQVTMAPNLTLLTLSGSRVRALITNDGPQYATSVSAGDKDVLYTVNRGRYREIEMVSMSGQNQVTPLGSGGKHDESDAVLSPDERWMAFQSDESGRPEVYIVPFRSTGEKLRVSGEGGTEPQWSRDGRSLFYLRPDGMLTNAEITAGARPRVAREVALFVIDSAGMMELMSLGTRHYNVTGDRILVREIPGHTDTDPVVILVNPRE